MHDDETRVVGGGAAPAKADPPRASLQVIHSPDSAQKGRRFAVERDDVTIGREDDNSVVVPSASASRRHARIFTSGGAHVIVDLESTNGTLLNGKAIHEQTLRSGDVIRVGSMVLEYRVEDA